jgi:hypothetical protein
VGLGGLSILTWARGQELPAKHTQIGTALSGLKAISAKLWCIGPCLGTFRHIVKEESERLAQRQEGNDATEKQRWKLPVRQKATMTDPLSATQRSNSTRVQEAAMWTSSCTAGDQAYGQPMSQAGTCRENRRKST